MNDGLERARERRNILEQLGSTPAVLLAWVLGGVLALTGALSYAELGGRFPRSAGEAVFTQEAFGRPGLALVVAGPLMLGIAAAIALIAGTVPHTLHAQRGGGAGGLVQ